MKEAPDVSMGNKAGPSLLATFNISEHWRPRPCSALSHEESLGLDLVTAQEIASRLLLRSNFITTVTDNQQPPRASGIVVRLCSTVRSVTPQAS
jgi:hypothetical protein